MIIKNEVLRDLHRFLSYHWQRELARDYFPPISNKTAQLGNLIEWAVKLIPVENSAPLGYVYNSARELWL